MPMDGLEHIQSICGQDQAKNASTMGKVSLGTAKGNYANDRNQGVGNNDS